MYKYYFKKQALNDIRKLPKDIQKRIIYKLDYYISTDKPLSFVERLINNELGEYRFRIGDYRVIFDVEDEELIILTLDHRREIYK